LNHLGRRQRKPAHLARSLARGFVVALGLAPALAAQGAPYFKAHYRKFEAQVPMRDGTRLYTAVYTPKTGQGPWPVLVHRTGYGVGPYGPDGFPDELGPSEELAREGFIYVEQDVRGKFMSEGTFQEMTPLREGRGPDEASDAWDTIEWAVKHVPGNNGRVGAWGISYDGFYAACALVGAHPALRAVSPQAPIADLFAGDDDHHNGALFLSQAFWFHAANNLARSGPGPELKPVPNLPEPEDGYRFFLDLGALPQVDRQYFNGRVGTWTDLVRHGNRDAYWRARDLRPHLRGVRPAVLVVGGWFDAEDLFGTLQVHQRVRDARHGCVLVMGPWKHGGWSYERGDWLGPLAFGMDTGSFFQAAVEAPFFRRFLKGGPDPDLPGALVFETGGNRWRRFASWPPPAARPAPLYLQPGFGLDWKFPAEAGDDRYVSDPGHPVPYEAQPGAEVAPGYMVADQRFAAGRPDVLVYRGPVLEAPLTVAGPVPVRLQVSTTGTDADWVVKLVDEYPGEPGDPEPAQPAGAAHGYQQLVRAEVMRGKFRNSLERPEPFVPDRPTEVAFTLNDICHTFRAGHRIMVQIQSSWFPLVDRNPQVFEDIYRAKETDFKPALHRVYRTPEHPSCLVLPVLDE
jgi:hypothetical protein